MKPLLRLLGSVLRVIVLLEGEPLPQSEVLSALKLSGACFPPDVTLDIQAKDFIRPE